MKNLMMVLSLVIIAHSAKALNSGDINLSRNPATLASNKSKLCPYAKSARKDKLSLFNAIDTTRSDQAVR